ncbi:3-hydroxyisobutyryl-CoA hydrolase [Nesidiocoris tenuis]|uniref:3-hydroxyisobutyryl-CoA hydrolase, mitochondrial n=1 Tax=Nesidiocoris tenuis TaxID=355587 RepID=A0ABN7A6K0_9HEMI|nr:3-hydroxyisobutyryl-CoA hydrolase [Nesidiocoris tenuis]
MTSSIKALRRLSVLHRILKTSNCRSMSSSSEEVLFEVKGKCGVMTLNRPKALNALNTNMVDQISCKLSEWERDKQFIVVRGQGRAFCAGGDIVNVTRGGPKCTTEGEQFFRKEYSMNYRISELTVPYVALIDGITMGGGVGLSVHGKYRIATENTLFAMPETQIGLFPDVGGSYFLSRLGPLGMYLALTGVRLKGADVAMAGVATHYIETSNLPAFLEDIENKADCDNLDQIIKQHSKCLKSQNFTLSSKMSLINKAFSHDTIEEMLEELKSDGSEWSMITVDTLKNMSPTSLKITIRELQEGAGKSLKECLQMEYRLAVGALRATASNDFYEGVRALLVDKDKKPVWNPPTVEAVDDDKIAQNFDYLEANDELVL